MNSEREGNCEHTIEADRQSVWLSNDNDGFYKQQFESREEIDNFIKRLADARDDTFPKK